VTADVVIVKVPVVFPDVTVTLAGTVATAVLPLVSGMVIPPAGAAAYKVTVPVDVPPP
jgi:hypothetical protein